MLPPPPIVRTKLTPPRLHRQTLRRPRLTQTLLQAQEYRLTIVQAGTGYGKSTALAALAQEELPAALAWYHLDSEDSDPQLFLLHLVHSLQTAVPHLSTTSLALLERWEQTPSTQGWTTVIDTLINELLTLNGRPILLILDDAHRLNPAADPMRILDRLIGRAPAHLHTILSTRYPLKLPTLLAWRVRNDVLEISQETLAFTPDEIITLFRDQYGRTLSPTQVDLLVSRTEGWPIALPLVWQRLQGGQASLETALGQLSSTTPPLPPTAESDSMSDLFRYLAHEVLEQQPADVQQFLRETAVLRQMTATDCDILRRAPDSPQLLRYLRENGLFIMDLGDGYARYHHLFRDLLLHQLTPHETQTSHQRAAALYQTRGQLEEAIYHLLAAQNYAAAATLLSQIGRNLVQAGRLNTLTGWIGRLPPPILEQHPPLIVYLGDVARLHSRFDEALRWYQEAETRSRARNDIPGIGQALRGQARVYLDTVNPSQAEKLLQEALRLSDGQEDRESRARLLELLAENLLNQGRTEDAERYRHQARELRQEAPGQAGLSVRVLLRTGRLVEARRLLEAQIEAERREPVLRPRAHRETLLLLSLILAMQGEAEAAHASAIAGIERGRALDSPFITAVGHMRQGHAWLLHKNAAGYEAAHRCFQEAIRLSQTLEVPRLRVEAYWGHCQCYGFRGDLDMARQAAEQGVEIAQAAGDEWVMACIRLTLGAAYALARRYTDALDWLAQAMGAFRNCGDTFGETAVRLWQCLVWQQQGDTTRLHRDLTDLLTLTQQHSYDFLFLRPTLLGPPDPRALIPLLLVAREQNRQRAYAERLLNQLGLSRLEVHPGYQLRLQLLGPFRVWRGPAETASSEVPGNEWKRHKARQLFLFLLTHRATLWEREQIMDRLWPGLEPEHGQRDFKIALSTLMNVLEPGRERNAPSAFIARDGSRYGLRPEADIWLDVAEFTRLITEGDTLYGRVEMEVSLAAGTMGTTTTVAATAARTIYRQALTLYHGDYLQEYPYEEWLNETREHLRTTFLHTSERLAALLLTATAPGDQTDWEEAIQVAQAILGRDDCWENAYRVLMTAYARLGNRAQVERVYQRCVSRLQAELGVPPAPATVQLYRTLRYPPQKSSGRAVQQFSI